MATHVEVVALVLFGAGNPTHKAELLQHGDVVITINQFAGGSEA